AQLGGWGHILGSHTYSHPGLVALADAGGDVIGEITRTEELLRPNIRSTVIYLRPPYGNWRQKRPGSMDDKETSIVADILNKSSRFSNYVGPVNWDISAADYDFWRAGASAKECAEAYLNKIEHLGRGIVLMHDSSENEEA